MLNIFNMAVFVDPQTNIKIPGIIPVERAPNRTTLHPLSPFRKHIGYNPIKKAWDSLPKQEIKISMPGEGLPRIIHYCADQSGCGFWRMIWPADDLLAYNKAVVMTLYQMVTLAQFYGGIDAVRVQRQCTENQLEFIRFLRTVSDEFKKQTGKGFRIIWEVDDCIFLDKIPKYNVCREGFSDNKIEKTVKEIVHLCIDESSIVNAIVEGVYMDIDLRELKEYFDEGKNIKVLSKDLDTNVIEFKSLLACEMTNAAANVLEITDDLSGHSITCTSDHPIFTKNRGWVVAEELVSTDILDII